MREALPPLPSIVVSVVDDVTAGSRCDEGFLRVRRRRLTLTFPGGATSRPFAYDEAWRAALDAVTMAAHFVDEAGVRRVFLRSSVRPPVALRPDEPVARGPRTGGLWELPAGLVEPEERGEAGLRRCAARELEEELGVTVADDALRALGAGVYPSPGVIGERIYFYEVEVDPSSRRAPGLDGSPLEEAAEIVAYPLAAALSLADEGFFDDMKTELGLRRLAARYPSGR
ncbi:MAG: NUDIX hydrolase [Polyangiaceae bacterium]|nr:NUDIX hydrolase [Polyangiaceae bacterium]